MRTISGPVLADPALRPVHRRRTGGVGARCTQWAPGRRRGSIWHRRRAPLAKLRATASNLDTHSTWVGRGAHAVEFSKTVAPLGRAFLPWVRPGDHLVSPGPTSEYSAV